MAEQLLPSHISTDESTMSKSSHKTMSNIIRGYQLSQAVCVMAQLGIVDLLVDQFRSAGELAQATNTDGDSLKRLLYTLTSFDVFMVDESDRFSLTPIVNATESGILNRLNIVDGDMFVSVPTGADTTILSHILMSFDHSKMKRLLNNCRAAMTTGAKVLIIEAVLRNNMSQPAGRLNNLNMLVLLGGRYRNEQEYLTLLEHNLISSLNQIFR